jgi:glycosyltransferase involved in cell wall biosynthesis
VADAADLGALLGGGRCIIDARYVAPKASGIGNYVRALVERLPPLAPQVQFRLWTDPRHPAPVTAKNVTSVAVAAPADGLRTLLRPSALDRLRPEDVLHLPFSLLGRGLCCATVVTIHDLMWLEQPELVDRRPWLRRARQGFYQQGMRWALSSATRIIAVSEATAARIREVSPSSAERVRVTHNAAGLAFEPAAQPGAATDKSAALLGSRAPYYVVVGKNEPYKAHDVALRAFARVAREDELLVLVQRTGSGTGLEQLAAQLGIAERVRWLPGIHGEELVSVLQSAQALLQPSIVEGFGMPVLEAMACGCPVIASDTPALVEVLDGAGLHARVGDPEAFASALQQLREPGVREQLRQKGLLRSRAFSWEQTAAATLQIYREAAEAARKKPGRDAR